MVNGRLEWWWAAVFAKRGDREKAVGALRDGLSRGLEFGMELHHAFELEGVRRCPGWAPLVRPRG